MNHVWVHVWPVIDAQLDQLTALQRGIAPLTAGAGIDEVLAQGRVIAADGADRPGRGPVLLPARARACSSPSTRRRPSGCARSTTTPRRCCARGGAARSTRTSCRRWWPAQGGTAVEHDLDDAGPARTGGPAGRTEQGRDRGRRRHDADRAASRGRHPRHPQRRPDARAGRRGRGRVRPPDRRDRPGRGAGRTGRVVRPVGRRPDLDGLGHREHGLGGPRPQAHHRVHPGRRRDQRRGGRHQRRRPAVLERRGDNAHAHQGRSRS